MRRVVFLSLCAAMVSAAGVAEGDVVVDPDGDGATDVWYVDPVSQLLLPLPSPADGLIAASFPARVVVGQTGEGILRASDADPFAMWLTMGEEAGSRGVFEVVGSDVDLTTDGDEFRRSLLGVAGQAELVVGPGASVTFDRINAAIDAGSRASVVVDGGELAVAFNFQGSELGLLGSFGLHIQNGGVARLDGIRNLASGTQMAAPSTSSCSIMVANPGSLLSLGDTSGAIGGSMATSITVTNGARLEAASSIRLGVGPIGHDATTRLFVGGPATTVDVSVRSWTGPVDIVVENGATGRLSLGQFRLGNTLPIVPTWTTVIRGPGTVLQSNGVFAGFSGSATSWSDEVSFYSIVEGAVVQQDIAFVEVDARWQPAMFSVEGPGSQFLGGGGVQIGVSSPDAVVRIADGALCTGQRAGFVGDAVLEFVITDAQVPPRLVLDRELWVVNGRLRVAFGPGFVPALGDSFDLIDADPISGPFTAIELSSLPDGLAWDLSMLYTEGVLRVGLGPCNASDLAAPFGQLTFADIAAFLAAFNGSDAAADLAEPFGALTFADINAFLGAFAAGCP